jgi:hypothetical protein
MNESDSDDAKFFERFRFLRERIFEGSEAFRERVVRKVEDALTGKPEEPLGAAILVHALNFVLSWLAPEEAQLERPADIEAETAPAPGSTPDVSSSLPSSSSTAPAASTPAPPRDPDADP